MKRPHSQRAGRLCRTRILRRLCLCCVELCCHIVELPLVLVFCRIFGARSAFISCRLGHSATRVGALHSRSCAHLGCGGPHLRLMQYLLADRRLLSLRFILLAQPIDLGRQIRNRRLGSCGGSGRALGSAPIALARRSSLGHWPLDRLSNVLLLQLEQLRLIGRAWDLRRAASRRLAASCAISRPTAPRTLGLAPPLLV